MGLFQTYIISDIKEQDWDRVGQAELMSIEVFPTLNERLYLCFLYGKNINPEQDISLGKPLPDDYETYIDILTNSPEARRLYLESMKNKKGHFMKLRILRKTNQLKKSLSIN